MPSGQISEVLQHLRRTVLLRDGAGLTDGQLLEDYICRREETALASLVCRHGPMVWAVCRRVLRNHHNAEDAFQATFLVLVRKAASVVPREMVANWLYGVAHQTALKARATTAKRRARERQVTQMPEPAVTEQDLWNDLQPLLDQELSRLPDKYRVAIVLCELEGKTRKEAARQLGVPDGTLAARLARGRLMLAKRLARHGLAVSSGALVALLSQGAASASVPTSVVSSTIKAASFFAAGQAVGGLVSAKAVALAEGVLKTMFLTKLKTVMTVLVVVAMVAFGAGLLGNGTVGGQQSEIKKGDAVAPQKETAKNDNFVNENGDKPCWREMLTMQHEHAITAIACSSDWSVAGDDGGNMFAWDTKTGKDRRSVCKGGKTIDRLQFTADEKDQFTADGKSLHVIWGGRKGIARYFVKDKKFQGGHGFGGVGYLGVSADAEICLELFREGEGVNLRRNAYEFKMGRFDVRPNFDPNQFETVEYKAKVSHALVSADDKWLAVATKDGTLHIHDRASLLRAGAESHPQEKHTIAAGKQGVVITGLQFSADGQRIAVARDDALAKVYDTAKGEEVATLKGHSGIVFAVAFSPDGKKVVTGADDNTARIWDAATGKALATLGRHKDSVRCAAFDPSGEILVTGSADKTVKLWTVK